MTPYSQPNNCIHGKLCTGLNNYIKSVLPSGKYAIQKCLDINYQSCPYYCASHTSSTDRDKVLDDYNGELLTKLVQELAGTWRMRDAKLFSIIRKYRRVPIGAMKELRKQEQP